MANNFSKPMFPTTPFRDLGEPEYMQRTFSEAPFRQQARRERQLSMQSALSGVGRAPGDIPVRATSAGLRGVDLAQAGAAQLDRQLVPSAIGLSADLIEMQRKRRLLAEESMRRDALRRSREQAIGRAVGSGAEYASALLQRNLGPLADRFLSGLDTQPVGSLDLESDTTRVQLPGGSTAMLGEIA
jgi:hypothetical protein